MCRGIPALSSCDELPRRRNQPDVRVDNAPVLDRGVGQSSNVRRRRKDHQESQQREVSIIILCNFLKRYCCCDQDKATSMWTIHMTVFASNVHPFLSYSVDMTNERRGGGKLSKVVYAIHGVYHRKRLEKLNDVEFGRIPGIRSLGAF